MKKHSFLAVYIFLTCTAGWSQLIPFFDQGMYSYGLTNNRNEIIIDARYSEAYTVGHKHALVKLDKYFLIDSTGSQLKTFEFDNMRPVYNKNYFTFYQPGKFGYVDVEGKILNEFAADTVYRWMEDNRGYVFFKNGKLGMFLMDYGMTIAPLYQCDDFMTTFMWDGNLYFSDSSNFALKKDGKWGIMSMYNGPVVPFEYDKIVPLHEDHFGGCKNGKWALLDRKNGKPLTGFDYDYFFGRYKSPIHMPRQEDPYIFLKAGKIVFFHLASGKIINEVPAAEYAWQRPAYMTLLKDTLQAVINPKGEFIIGFDYSQIATEIIVDTVKQTPVFKVWRNGEFKIMDAQGKTIYPSTACEHLFLLRVDNKPYVAVKKNNAYAVFDLNQKPLCKFEFDSIESAGKKFMVYKNGNYGLMDTSGKVVWNVND